MVQNFSGNGKKNKETYLAEILKAIELVMIHRQGYLLRKKILRTSEAVRQRKQIQKIGDSLCRKFDVNEK